MTCPPSTIARTSSPAAPHVQSVAARGNGRGVVATHGHVSDRDRLQRLHTRGRAAAATVAQAEPATAVAAPRVQVAHLVNHRSAVVPSRDVDEALATRVRHSNPIKSQCYGTTEMTTSLVPRTPARWSMVIVTHGAVTSTTKCDLQAVVPPDALAGMH